MGLSRIAPVVLLLSACGSVKDGRQEVDANASPLVAGSIAFVQVNSATPQIASSSVAVTYVSAQTAGDLNVVVVGWNDTTAQVSSVTDKAGNTFAKAIGPTVFSGQLSQSIYYAPNIHGSAAGTNTVTVAFSAAAQAPDIRILEYSGAASSNPVDVTAGAFGSAVTCSSGPVTTTNADDLLFGANMTTNQTTAPGAGFTSRVVTSPDGDIAEDDVVIDTGSYSATASQNGNWVMQLVAFKAASGTTSTTTTTTGAASGGTTTGAAATTGGGGSSGANVRFVQVNSATPQSASSSVTATYSAAQAAGDLNVVVVGWNDSTAQISALTDKAGNVYAKAIGPTVFAGQLSQSIYYASNIHATAAGANAVTVTFSVAAQAPDIRILEYGGLASASPVDVTAGATGNAATCSSGPATTTNADDLLFGANMTTGQTTAPGSGFTSRVITSPDSDIAEDQVVTSAGSHTATATQSGNWVMQLVAFKAATGGTSTTTGGTSGAASSGTTSGTTSGSTSGSVPTLVQHDSSSNTQGNGFSAPYCYSFQLPNPTTAGNAVVVGFTFNGDPTPTVTDDKGDHYTLVVNGFDSAQAQSAGIAAAVDVAAGARVIALCFSADPGGYVQPMATEFANVVGVDGAGSMSFGTGVTASPGSLTPTAQGDLVYQVALSLSLSQTSFAASTQSGATWELLSADLKDGWAGQSGVLDSTSSINPSLTLGTSDTWVSAGILLKAGTAGAVPAGPRIVHLLHENLPVSGGAGGNGTFPNPTSLMFPCSGNLLVAMIGGGTPLAATGLTDTAHNTWTQAGGNDIGANNQVQAFYAAGATCSDNLGLKVSWSGSPGDFADQTIFFYDVAGAASAPFDTVADATGSQNSQPAGDTLTMGYTLTPATASEIVFSQVIWDLNTGSGLQGQLFDTNTFSGESESGPEPVDENNGWGHLFTTNTSPLSFVWGELFPGLPVGGYAGMSVAFKVQP